MKRSAIIALLLAAAMLAPSGDVLAKKKDQYPGPDDGVFVPPGQAKPKGPPPWAPAHGYRAKQRYRYYPAHNIYQDPVSGLFFSMQGGIWTKGGLPPGMMPGGLGHYKEFEGYQDEPWKNNPYSGKKKKKD